MLLIPFKVDALQERLPVSNLALIALCVLVFVYALATYWNGVEPLVLDGWNPVGLLGYAFVHADGFHLLGNMLFLWVFGNALSAKVGDLPHIGLFVAFALVAAVSHNLVAGGPMVGASGAINGLVGLFLALHPVNRIHCFYWVFIKAGTFSVRGIWIVGFWFLLDLRGALLGAGGVAYVAHLAGTLAGVGIGLLALHKGWIRMSEHDNETLLDILER